MHRSTRNADLVTSYGLRGTPDPHPSPARRSPSRPSPESAGRTDRDEAARVNHVDHTLTDQTSVIHFVEANSLGGERIGDASCDVLSGPLTGMFSFDAHHPTAPRVFLDPNTGEPAGPQFG